jgi:hypothetical protein
MHIIHIKRIEEALQQARDKQRNHRGNPLSEASIEAKACIDCFEFVLGQCKEIPVTTDYSGKTAEELMAGIPDIEIRRLTARLAVKTGVFTEEEAREFYKLEEEEDPLDCN